MKHTRTNNSDTEVTIKVSLDTSDLSPIEKRTLNQLAKKVKVAGFRPGKAPVAVAKKHIDHNTLNMEIAEEAVNHFLLEVIEAEALQPLDRPKVELDKYVPSEGLEFIANIEILPEIKLGDYKKLKAKKDQAKIADNEIDEVIGRMLQGTAQKSEVTRAAKKDDEVLIDFHGTKAGKDVPGASGKDYPLILGSNSFIPGFEEGIIGKKAGDNFELVLTFPKDYHHKPLAGEKVTFAVTLKKVNEVIVPELTDEFAAKLGPFKTVTELRADVTRELNDQKEREALDKLKDQLIEQLVAGSHIPAPEILITDQLASLERDFTQNLMYRGLTLPQYLEEQKLTKDEWLEKELRVQALRRVQVGLALAELSKVEKIEVSTAMLEERLAQMLQEYGSDASVRSQLDTPEVRRDIANRLITEKTVERLVQLNTK